MSRDMIYLCVCVGAFLACMTLWLGIAAAGAMLFGMGIVFFDRSA